MNRLYIDTAWSGYKKMNMLVDVRVIAELIALVGGIVVTAHIVWSSIRLRSSSRSELGADGWNDLVDSVQLRRKALMKLSHNPVNFGDGVNSEKPEINFGVELSATDLFVEKVQGKLTNRGDGHQLLGIIYGHAVLLILSLGLLYLLSLPSLPSNITATYVTARFLSTGGIVGLGLGIAFFFASLAKAHLHEATVLYNKRHAVRLGRLFLYLKFLGLSGMDLAAAKATLTAQDMEQAFGSNPEVSTGFKAIEPEVLTRTPANGLVNAVREAIKSKTGEK